MNFTQLDLIRPIQRALTDAGYMTATEIQAKAIPLVLEGKDILGCAQTGTGKTAAFAIPALQMLQAEKEHHAVQTLVLTPTRELALQIEESFNAYAKYLQTKSLAIFGGVPQGRQVTALKKGVEVLIATPGRLLDLMQQGIVDLSQVKILVLDEADHMLDMGFINDVKKILVKVPVKRQTLLFSATMPVAIRKFAATILKNPLEISVTPVSSTVDAVAQSVYYVEKQQKTGLLVHLLKDKSIRRSLVFTRTKHGADKLVKQLSKTGIYAAAIHGNKSQQARQRALADFKDSKIRVLVATDIAARGIDIDELPHVVNYELPNVPETYVHRIGRTGRAGRAGVAVSFCDMEQRNELRDIQKLIGFKVPVKGEVRENGQLMSI
ncbi:MAG TPA: DEAD/DEAH box helicase [Edaphocola sp.]|nr:DEAD/DEAH box helicase [Edaphocola sp.]